MKERIQTLSFHFIKFKVNYYDAIRVGIEAKWWTWLRWWENGNRNKTIILRKKFQMHAFALDGNLNLSLHEKKVLGGIPTRVWVW